MKIIVIAAILSASLAFSGCATFKAPVSAAKAVNHGECSLHKPVAVIEVRPAASPSKNNFALGAKAKRHPSAVETIFR